MPARWAIYGVPDESDAKHAAAYLTWFKLLDSGVPLFTTNCMEIIWVDEATHALAMTALLAAQRRKLSLVDCVSFAAMRRKDAQEAFAFDQHFVEERFVFPRGDGAG